MSKNHLMMHYSVLHGYVVPDSQDGFDGLDLVDPTGLVTCPFVKIPYDQELDDSHSLQDSITQNKVKKRKKQEGDKGEKKVVEEVRGNVAKKIKEVEEEGPVVKAEEKEEGKLKEGVSENNEDEIGLPNLIMGILYPKYKTMPEYRVKWKTVREERKEREEVEEKKKMEEMKKLGFCKKKEDEK